MRVLLRRMLVAALVLAALAAWATPAVSSNTPRPIPDPDNSHVELGPDLGMTTCPAGEGPSFEYITVFAVDAGGAPVEGIPASSFFFMVTGGDAVATIYDEYTDSNGAIRFRMHGEESITTTISIECQIYTVVLNDIDYMDCRSVDADEDDRVGLLDYVLFGMGYLNGDLAFDYDWDDDIDPDDLYVLQAHFGHYPGWPQTKEDRR